MASLPRANTREVHRLLEHHRGAGWARLTQRWGRNFRYSGGVVTADPEITKQLLMQRPHTVERATTHRHIQRLVPGSAGILFKDGEDWHRRLRALMPTFTRAHALRGLTDMHGQAQQWLANEAATGRRGDDLFFDISALSQRVVLAVGYNLDPDVACVRELGRALLEYKFWSLNSHPRARIDEFGWSLSKLADVPWVVRHLRNLGHRFDRVRHAVQRVVHERPWLDPERKGWVQNLLDDGFGLAELTHELNHLYGAYNAVDFALTAGLYELFARPEWLAKVRAERTRHQPVLPSMLESMPATRAVMQETLRLYPAAMVIFRRSGSTIHIDGEAVAPGTTFMIITAGLHQDRDLWANAETFDPTRWLPSAPPPPRFAYIPFLHGNRKCIGQHLAECVFMTVMGTLIDDYDLHCERADVRLSPFIIPRFDGPIPYRLSRRSDEDTRARGRATG
ncbi:MAG: cytochrome P450 [Myxococcota bacterium]